jgi:putative membrane protein
MVSWFAGIFYLPRLFVYHVESENQDTKDQLTTMQTNLIRFITPLGSIGTIVWFNDGFSRF